MYRSTFLSCLFVPLLLMTAVAASAQKIANTISFTAGQQLQMVTEIKSAITQEMMGQSMDMTVQATTTRLLHIQNVTNGTTTIDQAVKRIQFSFDGMGKTETFDSDKESDMQQAEAKEIQKALKNNYTMTVDNTGKILSVTADRDNPNGKKEVDDNSDPMAGVMDQLFTGTNLPEAGDYTEFKVLPDHPLKKGDHWIDTTSHIENEKRKAEYTLTDITGNEAIIHYTEESTSKMTQENMGMEVTLNRTDSTTGTITLDRKTNLLKQHIATTQSTGTAEVMGQSVPINSKIEKIVTVKQL